MFARKQGHKIPPAASWAMLLATLMLAFATPAWAEWPNWGVGFPDDGLPAPGTQTTAIQGSTVMADPNATVPWTLSLELPPGSTEVEIKSEAELVTAFATITSNSVLKIHPGTYFITEPLIIDGGVSNVMIRGISVDEEENGIRDLIAKEMGGIPNYTDAVIDGSGIAINKGPIITIKNASAITFAHLTIRGAKVNHVLIDGSAGVNQTGYRFYNVRMYGISSMEGKQILKVTAGTSNGRVQYSRFEYTGTFPIIDGEARAIDIEKGEEWVIENNFFAHIHPNPTTAYAEPNWSPPARTSDNTGAGSILFHKHNAAITVHGDSKNTKVLYNYFEWCERAVSFGLSTDFGANKTHHQGGIIAHNMIHAGDHGHCAPPHTGCPPFPARALNQNVREAQIELWDAKDTDVIHNTIALQWWDNLCRFHTANLAQYLITMEYADSTNNTIKHNLINDNVPNDPIHKYAGTWRESDNYTTATWEMFTDVIFFGKDPRIACFFENPVDGFDLHLVAPTDIKNPVDDDDTGNVIDKLTRLDRPPVARMDWDLGIRPKKSNAVDYGADEYDVTKTITPFLGFISPPGKPRKNLAYRPPPGTGGDGPPNKWKDRLSRDEYIREYKLEQARRERETSIRENPRRPMTMREIADRHRLMVEEARRLKAARSGSSSTSRTQRLDRQERARPVHSDPGVGMGGN